MTDTTITMTTKSGFLCCKQDEVNEMRLEDVIHLAKIEGSSCDKVCLFDGVSSIVFYCNKDGVEHLQNALKEILEPKRVLDKHSGFLKKVHTQAFINNRNWIVGEIVTVGIGNRIKSLITGKPEGEIGITGIDLAKCLAYKSFSRFFGGCNLFLVSKDTMMELTKIEQQDANHVVDMIVELNKSKLDAVNIYQSANTLSRFFNPTKNMEYIFYTDEGIAVREKTWKGQSIMHFFAYENLSFYLQKNWFTARPVFMRNTIASESEDRAERDYFISSTPFWRSSMSELYDATMAKLNMDDAIVFKPIWWKFFSKKRVMCLPNIVLCMGPNQIEAYPRPIDKSETDIVKSSKLTVDVRIKDFVIEDIYRYKWKKLFCCCCGEMQDEVLRGPRDIIEHKETEKVHL